MTKDDFLRTLPLADRLRIAAVDLAVTGAPLALVTAVWEASEMVTPGLPAALGLCLWGGTLRGPSWGDICDRAVRELDPVPIGDRVAEDVEANAAPLVAAEGDGVTGSQ
jgi:hypothetical protein